MTTHSCDNCRKEWEGPGERWHVFETQHATVRTLCDKCYTEYCLEVKEQRIENSRKGY